MSPERIITPDTAESLINTLGDKFTELTDARVFIGPGSSNIVAITPNGRIISDQATLVSLIDNQDLDPRITEIAQTSILELGIPQRSLTSLTKSNLQTAEDLMWFVNHDNAYDMFGAIRNFGDKGIQYVIESLIRKGLPLSYFDKSLLPILLRSVSEEELLNIGISPDLIEQAKETKTNK